MIGKKLKILFSDIRFWIVVFFLVRLIGITNPPLEVAHNWRQTTVTSVARNYLEIDNNILYPRIDIAGEKTGITGMEFPLLNYLIYLLSEIFGYEHWYGRLINLSISSFSLLYFYKLINNFFKSKIAFNATIVLLFSIWFSYSRKIMPDTFSMSFIIASIYYGSNYLNNSSKSFQFGNLLLYFFMASLGMLAKLPSGYLLIIFSIFLLDKTITVQRKIIFLTVSILSLLSPLIWYFHWVPHLIETYGVWHFFMGNSIAQGIQEVSQNLILTMEKFYNSALKYIGFIIFMYGLISVIRKKEMNLLYILIISFLSFLIVIFKIGYSFPHHGYYIIPFVPVMALIVGYGLRQIKSKKFTIIILLAICIEGVLNQQHDFIIYDKKMSLLSLEEKLNRISKREDLILINSGDSTTPMYFSHRKGWGLSNKEITNGDHIKTLKEKGLKIIVILKHSFGSNMILDLPIAFENENYCIYKL